MSSSIKLERHRTDSLQKKPQMSLLWVACSTAHSTTHTAPNVPRGTAGHVNPRICKAEWYFANSLFRPNCHLTQLWAQRSQLGEPEHPQAAPGPWRSAPRRSAARRGARRGQPCCTPAQNAAPPRAPRTRGRCSSAASTRPRQQQRQGISQHCLLPTSRPRAALLSAFSGLTAGALLSCLPSLGIITILNKMN